MDLYHLDKNRAFLVSQKALIGSDSKVLVLKYNEEWNPKYRWCLPGGLVKFNEDLIEGLKREVFEEIKLKIDVVKPIYTYSYNYRNFKFKDLGVKNVRIINIVYLCKCRLKKLHLSKEHTGYRWVTNKELKKLRSSSNTSPAIDFCLDKYKDW